MARRAHSTAILLLATLAPLPVTAQQSPAAQTIAYLEELWRSSGAPAISAAVMHQGRLVFSDGVGYADLDQLAPATGATVYNVGSVSKAIAAVAVLQLVEAGKVDLDDPIQEYVPSFPDKGAPITVRRLMTHTSGIRHYRDSDFPDESPFDQNWKPYSSIAEAIEIFKDDPLLFPPGEFFSYSSYAVNLLQGVVEHASGAGFEDYLRTHVWEPAGMLRTAFDVPERIVPHRARGYLVRNGRTVNYPWEDVTYKFAGGGMISTVEDLTRMGVALLRGRLMQPATLALMFETQLDRVLVFRGDEPPRPLEWEQALIWRIRKDEVGRDFIHHCGSVKGFGSCLVIYAEEDLVVATADNANLLGFRPTLKIADFFRPKPAEE